MLQDLPSSLLGAVFRAAAVHSPAPNFRRLAPTLNLICRAAHEALPDAFTWEDNSEQTAGSPCVPPDPSPAFLAAACDDWPLPVPITLPAAVLVLNLDALGTAAYADQAAVRATLRRTAARFAHAHSVRLVSSQPHGVHGGALFAKHAAPLMVGVRSLLILGPLETPLPPFWQLFPPLVGLAAGVRELTIKAHHSAITPLAARLPLSFPALSAAHLCIFFDRDEARFYNEHLEAFSAATVLASSQLTTLLVAVHTPEGRDDELGKLPFTLTVAGDPSALRCLRLHTFLDAECLRPWLLHGILPALRCLDVTACPWKPARSGRDSDDEVAVEPAPAADTVHSPQPPLRDTCPSLTHVVLRTGSFCGVRHWDATLGALAPLAAGLVGLDVYSARCSWVRVCEPAELLQRVSQVLPGARPRFRGPDPCF